MKMRVPCTPLITVDPYFSVWSSKDKLYDGSTTHWTGAENRIDGFITVDGEKFCFMGRRGDCCEAVQPRKDMTAFTTEYEFSVKDVTLSVSFFIPLFPDKLYYVSRPVSYMSVKYTSDKEHNISVEISASEQLCINRAGTDKVVTEEVSVSPVLRGMKMGSATQKMFEMGDDIRIDWGYFYLVGENATATVNNKDDMTFVSVSLPLEAGISSTVLFAYDDIHSLEYFGRPVDAYWKTKGISIEEAICEAFEERDSIYAECLTRSASLVKDAENKGGEKYAELLCLAYRQLIAAHKLATDENGEVIFISKECFSNGCAATVDVTYPSSPFFILYNTELLKGMLRPIFRFSQTEKWTFDFAPHDAGTYPVVNGQRYGHEQESDPVRYLNCQMPVEECGNMMIMMANIVLADGSTDFADKYMPILEQWVNYLVRYGEDPENQLCTDDFAGHFAHNCNLSLKAIMGIAGYSIILGKQGREAEADKYMKLASEMADSWVKRAANADGSFRLAFDRPDTFSMKYNIVWDKIWKTGLFAPCVFCSEFTNNKKHIRPYGMPLDNRKNYTKSDWLVWTACLANTKEEFSEFIAPLWNSYNVTFSRVPMTDWYDTDTANCIGFRNRTVQGGLFIRLMFE